MSFTDFEASVAGETSPPARLSAPLRALWLEAKGDWSGAHDLALTADRSGGGQSEARAEAWVHAYLHRKEGDEPNAAYWYARAGRPVATGDLATEWREIVIELLDPAQTG